MPESLLRKRLTREESRAQTRDRLLDAALTLFSQGGIDAASIEEVAETAGYSRGAFYSNFDTKDQMVCAVLEREIRRNHEDLHAIFSRGASTAERIGDLRAYYLAVNGDANGCMFWMAMQLYALRNEGVRPQIAALLRSSRAMVVESVRRVFEELGKEPPVPPEMVAFSLIAQAQGLAISRMLDPDTIKVEQVQQALGTYFDRLFGL